jgi:hypothetical protein
MRAAATSALVAVVALLAAVQAAGAATWTLADHPPPPPGSEFRAPLGAPGDLKFWAPNRGLLAVEGNEAIARGLFLWNGRRWRQLSTVCGGPSDTTRIAWAGPTEFWTISVPSLPRQGSGLALCRFKDGEVAASYSTPEQSSDPYRRMNAAACNGPGECWFGGIGAADPTNEREGSFHLRWDGNGLRSFYAPQGRGVSDLQYHAGRLFESTFVGARPEGRSTPAKLRTPEEQPRLIHRIAGTAFANDPFVPAAVLDPDPSDEQPPPPDATDLLALDADGTDLWAVGGGTASGAPPPGQPSSSTDAYPRGPIAARFAGNAFTELALDKPFALDERFADVAAVPGTDDAWVAVQRFADRRSTTARGKVARIGADGTVKDVLTLPASGAGRGAIAKIAFTSPDDGWAITYAGWIFHFTDGAVQAEDADPAFARLIDFRPNEAAAQFVPDAPPVDDSQLFAPPAIEIEQQTTPEQAEAEVKQLPALLKKVRSKLRGKRRLVITFTLSRRARIGVVGRRGQRVVARFRTRTFQPGPRRIVVKLDPKRYPKRISFQIKELDLPGGTDDVGGGDGDTVSTGGGDTATTPPAQGDTVATGSRR